MRKSTKKLFLFHANTVCFCKKEEKKELNPNIRHSNWKILTVDYFVAQATANCIRCILYDRSLLQTCRRENICQRCISFRLHKRRSKKKSRQKTYLLDLDQDLNSWKNVNADSFHQPNGANIHEKHIKYIFQLNHANKTHRLKIRYKTK